MTCILKAAGHRVKWIEIWDSGMGWGWSIDMEYLWPRSVQGDFEGDLMHFFKMDFISITASYKAKWIEIWDSVTQVAHIRDTSNWPCSARYHWYHSRWVHSVNLSSSPNETTITSSTTRSSRYKMAYNLKMVGRRGVWRDICDSVTLVTHSCDIFDLVVFEAIFWVIQYTCF